MLASTSLLPQGIDAALCDPGLKQDSSTLGYRVRGGNRCEGYYIHPVAGGRLEIASFTRAGGVSLGNRKELTVRWPALGTESVHVRAYSLNPKEYYRMDTVQSGGEGSFVWPLDIPVARSLSIGLVSWTKWPVAGSQESVYLPLSISNGVVGSSTLRLILVPSADPSEVYFTVAAVDASGKIKPPLIKQQPMKAAPYTAWRPISLSFPALPGTGLYYAEFAAVWESGGQGTARMYFYNPPAGRSEVR